jgi:hypothetical protein
MLPGVTAIVLLVFPIAIADFDYRYLLPVLPFACLAASFAFAPERVEVTREVGPAEGTGELGPAQAEPALQPGSILDSG